MAVSRSGLGIRSELIMPGDYYSLFDRLQSFGYDLPMTRQRSNTITCAKSVELGGDKSTQQADIRRAIALAKSLEDRS